MKKLSFIILISYCLFSIISCGLTKPRKPRKPSARLHFEKIQEISLITQGKIKPTMKVQFRLDIYNPHYGKKTGAANISIHLKKKRIFKKRIRVSLRNNGTAQTRFVVPVKLKDVYNVFRGINRRKVFNYRVKGVARVKLGGRNFNLPFRLKGNLPAVKLNFGAKNFKISKPKVVTMTDYEPQLLPGISFKKILKKAKKPKLVVDVSLDFIINSRTKLNLVARNANTEVRVGKHQIIKGNTPNPKKAGANRAVFRLQNRLNLNNTVKAIIKRKGKLSIQGSFNLHLPRPFNVVPVKFRKKF